MSQSVLISTFGSLREAALERVALAADADAGEHDAIVGAEDAPADVRGRLDAAPEHVGAREGHRSEPADPGRECPPRNLVHLILFSHGQPPAQRIL